MMEYVDAAVAETAVHSFSIDKTCKVAKAFLRRRRPLRRGGRVIGQELGGGSAGGGGRSSAKASPSRSADPNDLLAYGEEDDTSWLIPYVDVVSLLLAFLILALAMSKVQIAPTPNRRSGAAEQYSTSQSL